MACQAGGEPCRRPRAVGALVDDLENLVIDVYGPTFGDLQYGAESFHEIQAEVAIATSVLYLIPGVPLINGVIDIVEGHVLNGIARLTSALMLIVCIAVGLSCTLMIVKNGLL